MALSNTIFKKGHDVPLSWRKKISETKRGKSPAWNKGIPWSEETKRKVSESRKGKCLGNKNALGHRSPKKGLPNPKLKGKNHWNWKGGISKENRTERANIMRTLEYRNWRSSVFERDKYTCVLCGSKGVRLEADHIKPFILFPELRFDIENGRTLCVSCHYKTDTRRARRSNMSKTLLGKKNY